MNEKKCILIIDDDEDLSMLICDMLQDQGYEVRYAADMEKAYQQIESKKIHMILLDINLPDGTGFEMCQELRKYSQIPIIFVSARTSEDDKVQGLDIGGDDYLAKPYSLRELMSRIHSLMRRVYGEGEKSETLLLRNQDSKCIEINKNARSVKRDGVVIDMKPKEYDLLLYLAEHKGNALTKERLMNEVWGPYSEVEQSTLTVHIRWLREKLEEDSSQPKWIKTVWGVGYILEAL